MVFFVHTEILDLVVCGAAMLCFTVSQNFTFLPTRRILHPHLTFPSFCNGCCHPVGNKVTSYCDFPLGHQASSPGLHGHPQIFFRQVLHISCMFKKSDHLYMHFLHKIYSHLWTFQIKFWWTWYSFNLVSCTNQLYVLWNSVWADSFSVCSGLSCLRSLWRFIVFMSPAPSFWLLAEFLAKLCRALVYILTSFLLSFSWDIDLPCCSH